MSNNRTDRFIQTSTSEEIQTKKRNIISYENEVQLYDFISVKYFNGVCRVIQFKCEGTKEKDLSEKFWVQDERVSMLMEYYTVNAQNELEFANLDGVNDSEFINITRYKCHVPIDETNNELTVVGDLSSILNMNSSVVFWSGFNSKKSKKNEDEDFVLPSKKKINKKEKKTTEKKKFSTKNDVATESNKKEKKKYQSKEQNEHVNPTRKSSRNRKKTQIESDDEDEDDEDDMEWIQQQKAFNNIKSSRRGSN